MPSSDDPAWAGAGVPATAKREITVQAQAHVGNRCGQVGPDPSTDDPSGEERQYQSLRLLAAELNRVGECAAQWADTVIIKRPDFVQGRTVWEARHSVNFGSGCYLEHNVEDATWIYGGEAPPPPPSTSCSGIPRVGRFRMSCKAAQRYCDADPMAPGQEGTDWEGIVVRKWCEETFGVQNLWCTYGAEGTTERVAREKCGVKDRATWRSDGEIWQVPENPVGVQASCSGCTWLEVCAADGVTGCTRHVFE